MKKSVLILCLTFLLSSKVFAGDYYFAGIDCFKKGIYDKAASNLEHAVKINPKNVNARYYLAQTYIMQNRIDDAKGQYNRIILLAPDSDAGILSFKGLHLIKKAECGIGQSNNSSNNNFAMYQDNYLDYVLPNNGKILKWASFPLNVYIEPKNQKNTVIKAFQQWQSLSKFASFSFVNSPDNAQITVYFKNRLESEAGDKSYIAGFSKPYYNEKNIIKSEIYLLDTDIKTDKPLNNTCIFSSALHEIGHSLGFMGHSPNENDVMSATSATPKMTLTQRDLNTLNIFYKIDEKFLFARNKGQTDVKLQQAMDYINQTPDKAVGWANLGDIYRSKKMYSNAIINYQKAVSIEPQKAELYNLLGSTYMDMGNIQNAFSNLKKACDLDKSNTFYLYQFGKLCLSVNQKQTGTTYINSYLRQNPQNQNDINIQNLLKLYK